MKTKIIFAAIGGLVVGAAGGFVGGMYYSDRKNSEEKTREINEVKQSYAQKYASDFKSEANRIAKEIIFRAQEDLDVGADGDAGTPAEEHDNPSGDDNSEDDSSGADGSEDNSSGPYEPKPSGENPPWIIDPEAQVRHNNVFDNPVNPTAPVDYNAMSKDMKFTGQDQLNANMLRQESAASRSFGANKRAQKEALDNEEAQADLEDWYGQGRDRMDEERSDSEGLGSARADHEADIEINSGVSEYYLGLTPTGLRNGVYVITEQDYEVGNPMFQKSFAIYYEGDGVWTDEDYNRIEDPYYTVGCPDDLVFRGPGHEDEPDRVFVRNINSGTDYECVKYHRAYGEIAVTEVK